MSTQGDNSNMADNVNIEDSGDVMPAFIIAQDIGARFNGFKLGEIINDKLQGKLVEGIQEVRGLFRIYLFSDKAKTDLCEMGVTLNGRWVKVYSQNPWATGAGYNPKQEQIEMVRLTIKDLYKSVSNKDVVHMLTKVYKIELASEVKFSHYREENGELSYMKNFDRHVWVHPDQLKVPLPRNAQCGVWRCRIFYRGQFKSKKQCYKCFSDDHLGRNCKNPRCCKVCKLPGHRPGTPQCEYYYVNYGVRVFGGEEDPLSNHYPCSFKYNHVKVKSVEHAWFDQKAMKNGQNEIANMCLNADDAKEAKYLGKGIKCTSDWDRQSLGMGIMKDILRCKYKEVDTAREALYECWVNHWEIVEAVPKGEWSWWSTGLSKQETEYTHRDGWQGDNSMGKMLTEIMFEMFGPFQFDEWEEGFCEMGGPTGEYPPPVERESLLESVDSSLDPTDQADFTPKSREEIATLIKTHQSRSSVKHVRGGGGGGRGRAMSKPRSYARSVRGYSPRSPSTKRLPVSPLGSTSKYQKQQPKPSVVASKFAQGNGRIS